MNNSQSQARTQGQNEHFNLQTSGCGYLNRIRWVETGRRGERYLSCAIACLRGSTEKPEYTYIDLTIPAKEAAEIVEQLMPDVEQRRRERRRPVFVAFNIGDVRADKPYQRKIKIDGRDTGETEMVSALKGRLILIKHVKVDGNTIYQRNEDAADPAQQGAESGQGESQAQDLGDSQSPPFADSQSHEEAGSQGERAAMDDERGNNMPRATATQNPRQGFNRITRQGGFEGRAQN